MSQMDCLDCLRANPGKWLRVKDVQKALEKAGKGNGTIKNAPIHLLKLRNCGDIQMRGVGVWEHYKEFRFI